jgi:hypothetical protein
MRKLIFVTFAICLLNLNVYGQLETDFDYDHGADFSTYKTYNFTSNELLDELTAHDQKALLGGIELQLKAKGFTKSENPDILVDVHLTTTEMLEEVESVDYYGSNYTWMMGPRFSATTSEIEQFTQGSIFIDLIDKSTKHLVWQGRGEGPLRQNVSAKKRHKRATKVLKKIFQHYPPTP